MNKVSSLLQENQLKSTPARLAVLSYLMEKHQPLDAETIFVHIENEHARADKVTIYRILETFVQKDIIKRLEFGEGKYRYELAGSDHHHLICEICSNIEDISDCNISKLEMEIEAKTKFLVKRHSLEFFGVCQSCQR